MKQFFAVFVFGTLVPLSFVAASSLSEGNQCRVTANVSSVLASKPIPGQENEFIVFLEVKENSCTDVPSATKAVIRGVDQDEVLKYAGKNIKATLGMTNGEIRITNIDIISDSETAVRTDPKIKVVGSGTVSDENVPSFEKIPVESVAVPTQKLIMSGTVPAGEQSNLYKKIEIESPTGASYDFHLRGETGDKVIGSGTISVETEDAVKYEAGKISVEGKEIKIMPDKVIQIVTGSSTDSVKEVKLVKKTKDDSSRLVYEVGTEGDAKILGLFKVKIRSVATVDTETGQLENVRNPWWSFLTF